MWMRFAPTFCGSAWSGQATLPRMFPGRFLPEARTARVKVQPETDGFSTSALKISVGLDERVTISGRAGHVLQADAVPTTSTGTSFRVTKQKTAEDHFFGPGRQARSLDRLVRRS